MRPAAAQLDAKEEEKKETQRQEEERRAEQIKAKKRKTYNHSVGFSLILSFLFVIFGKESEMAGRGWRLG